MEINNIKIPYGGVAMSRITNKVVIDEVTGCHLWQGCSTNGGYGMLRVGSITDGSRTMKGVHVIVYEHYNGKVPKGMVVKHSCDTPSCCNPDHLSAATQRENVLECMRKGRFRSGASKGEDNGCAKLKENDVKDIRKQSDLGKTRVFLAGIYSVSESTIQKIATRQSWKHI